MLTLPLSVFPSDHPAISFLREAVTMRTALIGGAFLVAVSVALVAVNVGSAALSCTGSERLLVYPIYSRKGLVKDTVERCGAVHRGCTERAGNAGVYDCSPFMAPEGSF